MKRIVVVVSSITAAALLAITVLLFLTVKVVQAHQISNNNKNIASNLSQLKATPAIGQILTVQNQLNVLTQLHKAKPEVSRLPGYISQLTPTSITLGQVQAGFVGGTTPNTLILDGNAPNLAAVNQFVDTLKFATYTATSNGPSKPAFTSVILSSFNYSTSTGASFNITAVFDPTIFDSTYNVNLTVPSIVTTRSSLDQPNVALFQQQNQSNKTSGQ
jgi:hypothetical protein